MTLHPDLLAELLEAEAAVARDRLGGRVAAVDVERSHVYCWLTAREAGGLAIRLAGENYDAEPFRVAVVDTEGTELPSNQWPAQLFYAVHPVLQQPFACVRGTFEYHCHPSHFADTWEACRSQIRLGDLLDHLVRKAGR